MSVTRNILTSVFAGSVAGVVANYFVNRPSSKNKKNNTPSLKSNAEKSAAENSEELHYFV